MISISKIKKNNNNLYIKWSDGKESNYLLQPLIALKNV